MTSPSVTGARAHGRAQVQTVQGSEKWYSKAGREKRKESEKSSSTLFTPKSSITLHRCMVLAAELPRLMRVYLAAPPPPAFREATTLRGSCALMRELVPKPGVECNTKPASFTGTCRAFFSPQPNQSTARVSCAGERDRQRTSKRLQRQPSARAQAWEHVTVFLQLWESPVLAKLAKFFSSESR